MKNDLIERLNEITSKKNCAATTKAAIAEAIEVIQAKTQLSGREGQWIVEKDSTKTVVTCSSCQSRTVDERFVNYPYCPMCGAFMGG